MIIIQSLLQMLKRAHYQIAYFLERKDLDILIFKISENFENLKTRLLMKESAIQLNKIQKISFFKKVDLCLMLKFQK